jgi:tetratricopeptide (TPR) repeat protein
MLPTLQQAIAIDPDYASAWGRLAFAWIARDWICDIPRKSARDSMRRAVERSLALDRDNVRGLHALAYLQELDGDPAGAHQTSDRALAANPGDVEVLRDKGGWLGSSGQLNLGERTLQAALLADPASLLLRTALVNQHISSSQFDRAIEEAQAILATDPSWVQLHSYMAVALMGLGRPSEAVEAFRRSRGALLSPETSPHIYVRALRQAGRWQEIEGLVSSLRAAADRGQWNETNRLVAVHVELGDYAAALDVLERSGLVEDDLCSLGNVGVIRSDPAFGARLEAVLKANAAKRQHVHPRVRPG